MKRLFVTGLSGFVGQNVRALVEGMVGVELVIPDTRVDILNPEMLRQSFSQLRPDWVIHLAGQSHVPESFADPRRTYDINFFGTLNVLEALKESGFTGRLLYVGSSDVYGLVSEDQLPIQESQLLRPRSPYAVSKVAAEALCCQWGQTEGFEVIMARPFNHIGPGQGDRFAISSFARQITEIKAGMRPASVEVGDIEATRDFTDVRDVAAAYLALMKHGHNGEVYNVCSGREISLRKILTDLIAAAGIEVRVKVDSSRVRPSEQKRVRGSNEKLTRHTGWRPRYAMQETLTTILFDWEVRVKHG